MRAEHVKKEIRILGISDGRPPRSSMGRRVQVVGVVFRGAYWLEGVMRTGIERNGFDATSQIASMIVSSPHFQQTRLLMTDGLALAGLNIVNIKALHKKTGIPTIAVSKGRREAGPLSGAIEKSDAKSTRRDAFKAAGQVVPVLLKPATRPLYAYCAGIDPEEMKSVMKLVCTDDVPEPIRVARIFSSAFNNLLRRGSSVKSR